MNFDAISLLIAAILGVSGYFLAYWHNLRLAKRQERFQLINKQINEFYGPLFVLAFAGKQAYETLLYKLGGERRTRVFDDPNFETSEKDLEEWRLWVQEVFMPINLAIERLIVEKAYLLREEKVPSCLLDFITHIAGYKVVVAKWQQGDFSENVSVIEFPKDFYDYAYNSYLQLKHEQIQLISK